MWILSEQARFSTQCVGQGPHPQTRSVARMSPELELKAELRVPETPHLLWRPGAWPQSGAPSPSPSTQPRPLGGREALRCGGLDLPLTPGIWPGGGGQLAPPVVPRPYVPPQAGVGAAALEQTVPSFWPVTGVSMFPLPPTSPSLSHKHLWHKNNFFGNGSPCTAHVGPQSRGPLTAGPGPGQAPERHWVRRALLQPSLPAPLPEKLPESRLQTCR